MSDSKLRRGHIIRQLARPKMPEKKYEGTYWFLILLYGPIGLGPILFLWIGLFPMVILLLLTLLVGVMIHTKIQDAKRDAVKGKNFVESRTFVGGKEYYEQIEVLDIEPKAKPGKPYPFHKVRTEQEDIQAILSRLGESARVMDADEINRKIDSQIRDEVEAELEKERVAGRAKRSVKILSGLKKKLTR